MIKNLIYTVILLTLAGCSGRSVQPSEESDQEKFKKEFLDPSAEVGPKVYSWWLNGKTDTTRLKTEMTEMKNAGISGFDIFEIGVPGSDIMIKAGPAFLSVESLASIKMVIREAGKMGMTAGLNMASSWNAGGSWIKPEHAAKSIY